MGRNEQTKHLCPRNQSAQIPDSDIYRTSSGDHLTSKVISPIRGGMPVPGCYGGKKFVKVWAPGGGFGFTIIAIDAQPVRIAFLFSKPACRGKRETERRTLTPF